MTTATVFNINMTTARVSIIHMITATDYPILI